MTTSSRKKPCVAMYTMLGAVRCVMAPLVVLAWVKTVAPAKRVCSAWASSAVPGRGSKKGREKWTAFLSAVVRVVGRCGLDVPLFPPSLSSCQTQD